jgi:hypothetical protein
MSEIKFKRVCFSGVNLHGCCALGQQMVACGDSQYSALKSAILDE